MSLRTRRSLLRAAAATGAVASLAGCGSPARSDSSRPETTRRAPRESEFGTVVDVGARGRGQRSVATAIREHAGDDTLLYFPPGRYRLDDTVELFEFDRLALVGRDATVVPPDGSTEVLFDLGRPGRARGLLVEGLRFDIRAPDTGPRPLSAQVEDDLTLRDVAVVGRQDAGRSMMRVDVTHPDGRGLVERLSLPDGATAETGSTGLLVGDRNRGRVAFLDCHIEGFPDNGLYAEPPAGSIAVQGGTFANCGVSSLRVGGDSTVRGAQVRCDRVPEGFSNMRGIRLRQGRDVLVEDCTVEFLDAPASDGGITMGHWLEAATVRNTTVRIDTDGVNAVQVKDPERNVAGDGPIVFEGLTVEGAAGQGATIEVNERTGCRFEGATVRQRGAARDGFLFDEGRATVRDSRINVSGRPIVVSDGATVEQVNVSTAGPAPDWWSGWLFA